MKKRIYKRIYICVILVLTIAVLSCSLLDKTKTISSDDKIAGFELGTNLHLLSDSELAKIANELGVDIQVVKDFLENQPDKEVTLEDLITSDIIGYKIDDEDDGDSNSDIVSYSGEFSVSANRKVKFAHGNLYWDGSAKKYNFEENQYDFRAIGGMPCVRNGKSQITPDKDRGVFLWTPYPDKAYSAEVEDGISKATYDEHKSQDEVITTWLGITDDKHTFFANEDEVVGSEWKVLSIDEWEYLLHKRPDANNKIFSTIIYDPVAQTDSGRWFGIYGFVILPDNWDSSLNKRYGTVYNADNTKWYKLEHKSSNVSTSTVSEWNSAFNSLSVWDEFEKNGAVFIPIMNPTFAESAFVRKGRNYCLSPSDYWASSCGKNIEWIGEHLTSGMEMMSVSHYTDKDGLAALSYPYTMSVRMVKYVK